MLAIVFVQRLQGANGEIRWRLVGTEVPESLVGQVLLRHTLRHASALAASSGDRCGTAPRTGSARPSSSGRTCACPSLTQWNGTTPRTAELALTLPTRGDRERASTLTVDIEGLQQRRRYLLDGLPAGRASPTTSPHHSHALLHIFTQIIERPRSGILPG